MATPALSTDLHHIVDFAHRWYRYGGGTSEDIFVTFGLTDHDYFRRLAQVLSAHGAATGLDPATITAIREVCEHRLTRT